MTGDELKKSRLNAGMTQEQLAYELGFLDKEGAGNRSQIARYERGHQKINKRMEVATKGYFLSISS